MPLHSYKYTNLYCCCLGPGCQGKCTGLDCCCLVFYCQDNLQMKIKWLWKIFHSKNLLSCFFVTFISLPEQSTPIWPSEHWQLPSDPQVPWPLHVVLGLQNTNKIEKWVYQTLNLRLCNENLLTYLHNQLRRIDYHIHRYHLLCRIHDHCNWLRLHMELSRTKKNRVEIWLLFIEYIFAILDSKKDLDSKYLSSTWNN